MATKTLSPAYADLPPLKASRVVFDGVGILDLPLKRLRLRGAQRLLKARLTNGAHPNTLAQVSHCYGRTETAAKSKAHADQTKAFFRRYNFVDEFSVHA